MYQAAATSAANQSTGKNASGLQRAETENLARMGAVVAPVVDDVENLCAHDSAQHHQNAEVPGVVRIDALLLRIAHTDPQSDQHAQGDQQAVGGQTEIADMKKSREHCLVRCETSGISNRKCSR